MQTMTKFRALVSAALCDAPLAFPAVARDYRPNDTPHLSGALFAVMAGIDIIHVPYKGTGPAFAASERSKPEE